MNEFPQNPQLPPSSGGYYGPPAAPPTMQYPAYPGVMGPQMIAVPPTPPPPPASRGTGVWIAITAAVTAGIVASLLLGFFIGRDTRLSNSEVQSKINQQATADQISQERALNNLRRELNRRQQSTINRVSARAEARGRREGRAQGEREGFASGQNQGFSQGRSEGFSEGQSEGLETGACIADFFYC